MAARLRGSYPVRIGNEAVKQLQLDVYGEVIDSLSLARRSGLPSKPHMWRLQCALMEFLRTAWRQPDEGSGRCAAHAGTSCTRR